jgi:hypothetical protein
MIKMFDRYSGGALYLIGLRSATMAHTGCLPASNLLRLKARNRSHQPPALPPAPVPGSVWLRASRS